jgi:hypothetical protein
VLKTVGRAIVQCWPMLLAWFFAGWLGHTALVRLAGWAGNFESLWGLLILPLAVVVKLASYVGMFLALRPALRHFERLDALASGRQTFVAEVVPRGAFARFSFARQWGLTVVTGLLPFLVIYIAWGMIGDDLLAYGDASRDQFGAAGASDRPYEVTIGVMSVSFVVVAFVLRFLIGRFSKRLPAWTGAISAYLEAAWLLTTVIALRQLLAGVPPWFASRRMFGWFVDGFAALREQFAWFAAIGDAIAWLAIAIGDVLVQPLAWLALAAIVYAGALPRRTPSTTGRAARLRETAAQRWRRVPRPIRRLGTSISTSFRDRWEPIATALSLIWRNGPVELGVYILTFAVVTAGTAWLKVLTYNLIGPHEIGWWIGMDDPLELLNQAITIPLLIVVVAAAFDRSLQNLEEQVVSADAELAEVLPEA